MKVTLVSCWHDDNKGDAGIVEATARLLLHHFPQLDLSFVSSLPAGHPRFADAYRHLSVAYPDVAIAANPSPVYYHRKPGGRFVGLLAAAATLPVKVAAIAMGLTVDHGSRLIRDSDLVMSKGGHFMVQSRNHPADWLAAVAHAYPLFVARRFGVPYLVFGQSLGPFTRGLGTNLLRWTLKGAQQVFVRESLSYSEAINLGIPAQKVTIIPDPAFGLVGRSSAATDRILREAGLEDEAFCVVTVRQWLDLRHGPVDQMTNEYLGRVADSVRGILDRGLASRVAIVAHTVGPIAIEDDRGPTRKLERLLSDRRVVVIDEDLSPTELVALYGRARFVIGTRLHSVLFALAGGTPAIAVSYFGPKAQGAMSQLGMSEFCLEMASLDPDELVTLVSRLPSRARIVEQVGSQRADLAHAISTLSEFDNREQ